MQALSLSLASRPHLRIVALLLCLLLAALPAAPAGAAVPALAVTPASAPQNSTFMLALAGYTPGESVSLWQTLPDYTVRPLADMRADPTGMSELRFIAAETLPTGTHRVSARGNDSGLVAEARFELTRTPRPTPAPGTRLIVTAAADGLSVSGAGFGASEAVALRLRDPGGAVRDAGTATTDGQGAFAHQLTPGLQPLTGVYELTATGSTSGLVGVAEFASQRDNLPGAKPGGMLVAVPNRAPQLSSITLVGADFLPGEQISVWLTRPDGAVLGLFEGRTADGTFAVEITLPALPVGRHFFTAYGQRSGLRAVEAFELLPGTGEKR